MCSSDLILVTHAPQVASYAAHHFLIDKQVIDNRTSTSVKELNKNEKVQELARMLAGLDYSPITLQHAEEMIKLARKP